MNIYKSTVMLQAIEQLAPRSTFLTNRYFKTNPSTDIFTAEEVFVDIKKGGQKIAPCVMPRRNGITIEREGYKTFRYTPPTIALKRPLTVDQLAARGFGEAFMANKSPMEREAETLRQDLVDLDAMIGGRIEQMAVQALFTNSIILKQYDESLANENSSEYELRFYDGTDDTSKYTPAIDWTDPDADMLADLTVMVRIHYQSLA